jgi:hypothetical protein
MPSYIRSGGGYMSGGGGGGGSDGCCCVDNSIDRNSALFFTKLADKLLEMSKSVEARIEEIRKNCNNPTQSRGFLFASIEVPKMTIAVNQEFFEYVRRHGPPPKGKFEPLKLHLIRIELGIPSEYVDTCHG